LLKVAWELAASCEERNKKVSSEEERERVRARERERNEQSIRRTKK